MDADLTIRDQRATLYTTNAGHRRGAPMSADVIPLRRTETVRMNFLRIGAAGQRLQAWLATWFDLLHKRSPEDRGATILCRSEIVN